ncbi:T9SS type A sorting domain-containing protein [Spirosoma pomorum]
MKNRYLFFKFLIACLPCIVNTAVAQSTQPIKITYPESRAVFQRENDNTATIYLSGNYYQPIDSVQARVQTEVSGQGFNTNWTTIQRSPQGGVFQGSVRAQGGWYRLEVRAFVGGAELATDVIRKIGIGEVFIVTGQSNAQGFQNFGAPAASDDRVNCVTFDNTTANSLGDPPSPMFQQLSASSLIGPRGQSAWCWGILGDLIAKQYNVPVLFINTAWQATVIKNWRESSEGKVTKNIFAMGTPSENFPEGMPYGNLITALRYYCSLQGLRAVLWQQGENDNVPLNSTRQAYAEDMQYLVNKTRADTKRYPAWVLARSSYNSGKVSQEVIQAQNDVINTYNNNVFAGPYTDNIQIPRYEGDVHFGGDGLRQLGQAWFESLSSVFFQSSRPLPALAPPAVTVNCATTNNNLTLTLPTLYKSYTWRTGQTSRSINVSTPGVYRAVLKDETGNTYLSPTVDVQGPIQPTTPVISLASQPSVPAASQQQVCADSTLALATTTTGTSTAFWSTSAIGNTVRVNQSGQYSVQALNVYGCRSAQSSPITLTVRSKLPSPSIEQIGTFTLQAVLPTSTGSQTDLYDWRRGSEVIPQTSAVVKVVVTSNYSARTKSEFRLNNNSLTCYSDFSAPKAFTFDASNGGLSVYPNPTSEGVVTIETLENLENAAITIYSLSGARVFATQIPSLNERKALDIANLAQGVYIIRVQSASFDLSKRLIINR